MRGPKTWTWMEAPRVCASPLRRIAGTTSLGTVVTLTSRWTSRRGAVLSMARPMRGALWHRPLSAPRSRPTIPVPVPPDAAPAARLTKGPGITPQKPLRAWEAASAGATSTPREGWRGYGGESKRARPPTAGVDGRRTRRSKCPRNGRRMQTMQLPAVSEKLDRAWRTKKRRIVDTGAGKQLPTA